MTKSEAQQMFRGFRERGGVVALVIGGVFLVGAAIPAQKKAPPAPQSAFEQCVDKNIMETRAAIEVAGKLLERSGYVEQRIPTYGEIRPRAIQFCSTMRGLRRDE